MIAQVTKTAIAVLVTGKFETLGSNFSHEIRFREAAGVQQIFYFSTSPTSHKWMMHKQKTKNFSLIAEATKTAVAVLVAGKFETLGSNFSHEIRFREAAGAVAI